MYRLRPNVKINSSINVIDGIENIFSKIAEYNEREVIKLAIETYPGVDKSIFINKLKLLYPNISIIDTDDLFISAADIFSQIQSDLTDDKSFGRFSNKQFEQFFDPTKIANLNKFENNNVIIIGVGAANVINFNKLVYVDISRWEIQLRYKKGLMNWKGFRENEFSEKLKRAYYFEWPAGDERRRELLPLSDYYIDANEKEKPKLVSKVELYTILEHFTLQPFRLVPYFDPGIWGGNWMQEKFKVGQEKQNLAWSFDGVPEENSIIAKINDIELEMPAQLVVDAYPKELLGEKVFGRYGRDFPIRFDYLDTMNGQNLSLQVHPTLDYSYRKFGAKYTQDESYYILDCKENAHVYLGVKNNIDKDEFISELEKAQETGTFNDEKFVNRFPIKKHDHILIPAGTVHSSGMNSVVLEISSTPNRFTFKLWDWGRLDLDGKPRPIAIDHGKHVINTSFDEDFSKKELFNAITVLNTEDGFMEEKTGLHTLESIETRRLTFDTKVEQETCGSVNMLNLVEGEHIKVISPTNDFYPFDVYYGETFVIPEQIKKYYLENVGSTKSVKVMKAYIR